MKLQGRWQQLAAWLIARYIRLVAFTGRWRVEGGEPVQALLRAGQPILLAFWHGRLLMIPHAYRQLGGRQVHILISEHRDGELIARTMAYWGYQAVRGSSRRGAVKGLMGMLRIARTGSDLAITPDGPRGPREEVQPGVLEIARVTGMPIVPVTFSARWARVIPSWDRFLLALPFTRGAILWGEPMHVPRDATAGQLSEFQNALESRMRALTARADRITRNERERA